jgi:hypothetical protein
VHTLYLAGTMPGTMVEIDVGPEAKNAKLVSDKKSLKNRRRDTFLSIEGCFLRDQFFLGLNVVVAVSSGASAGES